MAKKELFANRFFAYTFKKFGVFPVDRNKNDLQAYKTAIKILKNNEVLGIFVQGTRKKNLDGAKDGAAMFAIKTNLPIVPININANYKFFSTVKINIGKPIYLPTPQKLNQDSLHQATLIITNAIKNLNSGDVELRK